MNYYKVLSGLTAVTLGVSALAVPTAAATSTGSLATSETSASTEEKVSCPDCKCTTQNCENWSKTLAKCTCGCADDNFTAFLMFTDSNWAWGNWHAANNQEENGKGKDATITSGKHRYTVSINAKDVATYYDADGNIVDADTEGATVSGADGIIVFLVDIPGLADAIGANSSKIETASGTEKMQLAKDCGLTISNVVISVDGEDVYTYDDDDVFYGDFESRGTIRLEIYNAYGESGCIPGDYNTPGEISYLASRLNATDSISVSFDLDCKLTSTECSCSPCHTTHTYDKGKVTTAATCTSNGVKTYTCTVCKSTKTETISKTGHKHTVTKTVKPTVKAQGYTLKKCSVCGATTKTNYTAKLIAMSKTKVTGVKSTYTYTGKSITPTVTVKYGKTTLKKGTDYTVSYKNNTKTGKATVTITGKGKYSGTKTVTYIIVPKKATVSSAKSSKTKTVTVKWKKDSQATGYELIYSTNSKFKSAKKVAIAKNSTVTKTITKLTKGKTYYVKVRAYKTISGKKYYGAYSAVKSVKCK
jgi:hypothetical protein